MRLIQVKRLLKNLTAPNPIEPSSEDLRSEIGEKLFEEASREYPSMAKTITALLLELEVDTLQQLLFDPSSLKEMINDAAEIVVLKQFGST